MNIKMLTSAMGLGTYVPAVQVLEYLRAQGNTVTLELFENYFNEEVLNKYLKNKKEYHRSFKVAKLGHKLAEKKLGNVLEEEDEHNTLKRWESEKIEKFIIFSGNWIPVIEDYRKRAKDESRLKAIVVHMDIGTAPSWKHFDNADHFYKEILPIDEMGVQFLFEVPRKGIKQDVSKGEKIFFIHGGGWGMGDYRERKSELQEAIDCKVIELAHAKEEVKEEKNTTYYLLDPEWKPWEPDEHGEYSFPSMRNGETNERLDNQNMKALLDIYQPCTAIISKPGGGTVNDAILTETPVVFIEPVAEHERKNEEVFEKLGLGISFTKWRETGFSVDVLADIQESIRRNKAGKPGLGAYIQSLLKGE